MVEVGARWRHHGRTMLATLRKSWRLRITYPTWIVNRLLSPLAWVAIAVFAYVGIAGEGATAEAFQRTAGSSDFTGFLIIGQTIFTFFLGMNWRAGMAIHRERWYGTLEMMLLAPMSRVAWLTGEAIFGVLDSGWTVFLAMVAAIYVFGADFTLPHPGAAALALVLTLLAMVSLGLFFAGFYMLSRSAAPLSHAVQAPVRFFAGVQFPVAVLPAALQAVSFAIPVTWGLQAIRASLMEGAGFRELATTYVMLGGFSIVFLALGTWLLHRMEDRAKERGSLHQY